MQNTAEISISEIKYQYQGSNIKYQIRITCNLLVSDSVIVDGTGDQGSFVRGGDTIVAGDAAGARHGSIAAAINRSISPAQLAT